MIFDKIEDYQSDSDDNQQRRNDNSSIVNKIRISRVKKHNQNSFIDLQPPRGRNFLNQDKGIKKTGTFNYEQAAMNSSGKALKLSDFLR